MKWIQIILTYYDNIISDILLSLKWTNMMETCFNVCLLWKHNVLVAHIRTVMHCEILSVHAFWDKPICSFFLHELWHLIEGVGPQNDWFIRTLKTFVSFNGLLTFTFRFLLLPIVFTIKFLFHLNYIYNVSLTYTFV